MRTLPGGRWLVGGVALLAAGIVAAVASRGGDEGMAEALPGRVAQSESHTHNGVTVTAAGAAFSGTAVDVDLVLRDAAGAPVAAVPLGATLHGIANGSAFVGSDGRVTLHFPAAAWPADGATATLRIAALDHRLPGAGEPRIEGPWELAIALPQGEAAAEARTVQALQPATATLGTGEVTVRVYITATEVLVRYAPPPGLLLFKPPLLVAGGQSFTPTRAEQPDESQGEARYERPQSTAALSLRFENIVVPDGAGSWSLDMTLEPLEENAPDLDPEEGEEYEIRWHVTPADASPTVHRVFLRTFQDHRLEIEFEGNLGLGGPNPSRVIGDGVPMKVVGEGWFGGTADRGERSAISIRLPGGDIPRSVTISAGKTVTLPPVVIPLEP
ncbi:MAG: hypothetical protein IT303_14210 [Dehalococcoidia bacterium]|nr:hypothetical protein [Dehalococcoidia bacterium]